MHYCLTWPLGKPLPGLLEVIHAKLNLQKGSLCFFVEHLLKIYNIISDLILCFYLHLLIRVFIEIVTNGVIVALLILANL